MGPWKHRTIYTMFMSSVDQCIRFRATGGYICGCGRPRNLVYIVLVNRLLSQPKSVYRGKHFI